MSGGATRPKRVERRVNGGDRGSNPTCRTCAAHAWRSLFPPDGQVQGLRSVQGSAVQGRQAQACRRRAWRAAPWLPQCKGWDADWGLLLTTTSLLNGGLVHTRAPCCEYARLCVLRVWCLLSGQICYTEFCPGTFLNNTTVGSPISKQCCYALSKLQNLRPSHEERIVGTLASTPLVLGPLPVGAGPHQAEAAWAPPTPHRLRPAGVPWERRRGWRCANFAVERARAPGKCRLTG